MSVNLIFKKQARRGEKEEDEQNCVKSAMRLRIDLH